MKKIVFATNNAHKLQELRQMLGDTYEILGLTDIGCHEDIPEMNNMLHGDFHIKNIMRQGDENLLIDMDTLSVGHPIFEFAAIFAAYKVFSCVDKENGANFLGITTEQCLQFLNSTFSYYFEGESQETVDEIIRKSEIICYARILRWYIKKKPADEELTKQVIDFCKQYLIENVPKTDKLYF